MKELSIDEKAKAYDEALSKAKGWHIDAQIGFKKSLETLFPELKESEESEDERIRKSIIAILNNYVDNSNTFKPKMLAWLEKQGEPIGDTDTVDSNEDGLIAETISSKSADKVEPKFNIRDIIFNKKTKEQFTITGRSLTLQYYHDEDHLHEVRFTEQDDWEIIKPKFHEGDWVVDNCGYVWKIEGILNQFYILEGVEGGESRPTIEWVDKTFHLWTIKDAKDGDILTTDMYPVGTSIFIFKSFNPSIFSIYCYCFVNSDGVFIKNTTVYYHRYDVTLCPATKEQRNLFFQKMKEAGYEWDSEKKELKKQDEIAEIPFGAKDSELQEVTYYIPKGFHAVLDGNKVVIKRGEQKPVWSDEDKRMFDYALDMIEWYGGKNEDKSRLVSDWLKSLRPQKPHVYNPYKAVVESIAKMCDKYENCMCDEKEAKDFLANVAVKCHEAAEYDKKYMEELIMEQYIDKSALVAEIEKRIKTLDEILSRRPISWPTLEKLIEENKKVLSVLNTLEVKESDETAKAFARIVRANLTGIDKDVQYKFEQLYKEITGKEMYQGYND